MEASCCFSARWPRSRVKIYDARICEPIFWIVPENLAPSRACSISIIVTPHQVLARTVSGAARRKLRQIFPWEPRCGGEWQGGLPNRSCVRAASVPKGSEQLFIDGDADVRDCAPSPNR